MAHYSHIFLAFMVVVSALGIASVDGVRFFPLETQENGATTRVQGSIFCVDENQKWTPMKGARAVVYCLLFSMKSTKTDENGYFLVDFPSKRLTDDCRVYLAQPALGKGHCNVPTNINNGITGATPAKTEYPNLYTVPPFVYNPRPLYS